MNGIIPLWKPVGMTSHDCVIKLRRLFETKKVGHTGTLDPEVSGVLPICIGEATKIVPYLTDTKKTYRAEITLGKATDTEDQTGQIIEEQPIDEPISIDAITAVLEKFLGKIEQVTPLYSAVKVKGKKLYQYARDNQTVERPIRQVIIHAIELAPDSLIAAEDTIKFEIETTVSKGTYIRTLAVDIGKALGYPAHMSKLVRTATADFNENNSIEFEDLEKLKADGQLISALLPLEAGITHLPGHRVDSEIAQKVSYGQKLPKPSDWVDDQPNRIEFNQKTLAIYQVHPDKPTEIKPLRVFNLD
ncbi:MAG TPA: tRNA pseudouridine(55) synthase TruB [Bacilli bacterium]|nr:tRNA pseudouridine(55) synthase TruB [Bacilli bacterium]